MINQRQNLAILSGKKVHFKRDVLAFTELVELGDRGRKESMSLLAVVNNPVMG